MVNPSEVETGVLRTGITASGGSVTVREKVREDEPPGF
jgi:hypothetical protein